MSKLGLIISREYLTKVKNKSFIFTTLLTPLGFLVFFIVIGVIFSYEGSKTYRIALLDNSEMNFELPQSSKKFTFQKTDSSLDSLKAQYQREEIDGIIDAYSLKYSNFNVLLTGGDMPFFVPHLKNRIFADPNLIYKGLYAISEYNNR